MKLWRWIWRTLTVLGAIGLAGTGNSLTAAPLAQCTPQASGAWTSISWDCGLTPTRSDSVTIPSPLTVTVDANAEVGDLHLIPTGTRLTINSGVALSVYGTLTSSDTSVANIVTGGGFLRFAGGSRTLFGADWSAGTPGLRIDIDLDSSAIGTTGQNIKGGEILIRNGTFNTTGDVRPDNGPVDSGSLTIASGATLITSRNIERTGTSGAQSASIVIDGALESSGVRMSANTITVGSGGVLRVKRTGGMTIAGALSYAPGSTLEYAGSAAQTTGDELTTPVASLTVANANGVTLSRATTVTGQLNLSSAALSTGAYSLTLGDAATCAGTHEVVGSIQRLNPALSTTYCFGHPDTTLTFTAGTPPASVSATVSRGTPPFAGAVARRYTLNAPGFDGVATARLHYLDSELNGANEADLYLWRFESGRWRLAGRSTIDTVNNYVELSGVTTFSDWAIAENGETTAVTVIALTAVQRPDGVHLAWETADETLNAGFHVLRSDSRFDQGKRINPALIPSQTVGGIGGATYHYVDTSPSHVPERFYWLEDVELTGKSARHGPLVVEQHLLWLPLLAADRE